MSGGRLPDVGGLGVVHEDLFAERRPRGEVRGHEWDQRGGSGLGGRHGTAIARREAVGQAGLEVAHVQLTLLGGRRSAAAPGLQAALLRPVFKGERMGAAGRRTVGGDEELPRGLFERGRRRGREGAGVDGGHRRRGRRRCRFRFRVLGAPGESQGGEADEGENHGSSARSHSSLL